MAQDRFARRYGVAALTVAFTALIVSIVLSGSFFAVAALYESGALAPRFAKHR